MRAGPIDTVASLLAHAHQLEAEAAERYEDLAHQMQARKRPELAEFFHKMAAIELKHASKVDEMAENLELPRMAPWEYGWSDTEGPETTPISAIDDIVTPRQALRQAMENEERAVRFFEDVAEVTNDETVREMASSLAEEEREHISLLEQWLARFPESDSDKDAAVGHAQQA